MNEENPVERPTIPPIPTMHKPDDMSYTSWQHEKWKLQWPRWNAIANCSKAQLDLIRGMEISEHEYQCELNARIPYQEMNQPELERQAAAGIGQAALELKRRNGEIPR